MSANCQYETREMAWAREKVLGIVLDSGNPVGGGMRKKGRRGKGTCVRGRLNLYTPSYYHHMTKESYKDLDGTRGGGHVFQLAE